MKKIFILTISMFFCNILIAQSLSDKINSFFEPIVEIMALIIFWDPIAALGFDLGSNVPIVVIWLIFGALFFTFKMNFINIRGFKHAIDLVKGKYDDPKDEGEVSHFQALATALSATVGLGNIAGVAVAIAVGGPGATFWMIVAGLLGMSSKFVECTLGVMYRVLNDEGEVSGGPMYYLQNGLKKYGFKNLGKILAVIFAILCIGGSFGGGNMFQANQAFQQIVEASGGLNSPLYNKGWLGGSVFAVIVGLIIFGGIKSIGKVTEKLVPLMALVYVSSCILIIGNNFSSLPETFKLIFVGAFSLEATTGGVIGSMIAGIKRAVFSNESGIGSAPIAYAPAKSDNHLNTGFMSLLSPFIDTILVCSMTALVIIITGVYNNADGIQGVELTSQAFESVFSWFPILLAVAITLFAISTLITWSYYGLRCWTYLFGISKISDYSFKLIFLSFTIIGTSMNLGSVINFSDSMIFAMSVPNIIGLYFLSSELKKDLKILGEQSD